VGTAALGCPAERSSAAGIAIRLVSTASVQIRICGDRFHIGKDLNGTGELCSPGQPRAAVPTWSLALTN